MLGADELDLTPFEGSAQKEALVCVTPLAEGEYETFVLKKKEPAVHLLHEMGKEVYRSPLPHVIDTLKGEITWKVVSNFILYALHPCSMSHFFSRVDQDISSFIK